MDNGMMNHQPQQSIMREKGVARKLVDRSSETMEVTNEQELEYQRNLDRVKNVINKLKDAFKSIETSQDAKIQSIREKNSERIQQLRDELERLEDQKNPKTVIAIVGATGEGKSSLINALLDHRSVLPTSGHRACTAVVVEVEQNAESDQFEADIEFRSKEEWSKERECLLKDLTTIEGKLKTNIPDSSSESYASYLKMMAVYGKIDDMEESTVITEKLGTRKIVYSHDAEDFRQQVEQYIIQSEDTEDELQYWPIVERVRLKIPDCDVCSSGAKLVDLPGVSDYNAARENVTKEYLKTCKAVWVVSNIHRAIDAKAAKNLLDENFRRQLLMDGHYANIAFICSKTDDIDYTECTKVNKRMGVQAEIDEIRDYIIEKETEKKQCNKEMQAYQKETICIKQEYDRIQQLQSVTNCGDSDTISRQIEKETKRLTEVDRQIDQCKAKINGIEQDLVDARKRRSAICAKARNQSSSQQIKKDFKAGLREMKSQARTQEEVEEEEEEEEEEDEADNKLAESLKVFCCSATEYQRLQNPLPDDEPPKVFSATEDTQVPQLRDYVHTVTRESKKQAMDFLISSLCRLVSDVQNVMTNSSMKNDITAICNEYVKRSEEELKVITQTISDQVESSFSDIRTKLTEGSTIAQEQATATCTSWGSTQTPRKETQRGCSGPYPHKTYIATIYRQGEFRSPTHGYINFNEALVLPILKQQAIIWDQVFNHEIPDVFETTKKNASCAVNKLIYEMYAKLADIGYPDVKAEDVIYTIMMRLDHMHNTLVRKTSLKQRDLSRSVAPFIQTSLKRTYLDCSLEKGKGMFQRIKDRVYADIYVLKDTVFCTAIDEVTKGLESLMETLIQDVEQVFELLVEDLKTGVKTGTLTPSEYGALITEIKNCAKLLRPPGAISSSQGSQEQNDVLSILTDTQEGKRKQSFDDGEHKGLKRLKTGKNCYKPGDLDRVLIQSKVDYEKQLHIEQKLKDNCRDHGLEYLGETPRNGDCFFEAIASQLSRIGVSQSRPLLAPLQLRLKVSEYIQQHPTYEGQDGTVSLANYMDTSIEDYCEKMAKRGTWADHVVVITMARMLQQDIVIVTSSPSSSREECLTWVIGDESGRKEPLLLGHLWENHYQSLQPI